MSNHSSKLCGILLAAAMCGWIPASQAQVTVTETATTTAGTITEFTPASETLVIRSETAAEPLRYMVTKQTTFVDEAGAPVVVEKLTAGTPIAVQFTRAGDRLVASRIVVKRAPAVIEKQTTTTTTTRKLTDKEKEAIEEQREKEKERKEKLKDD
jgi:hypothetical protein